MPIQACIIIGAIFTIAAIIALYILVLPQSKDGNLGGFGQFLYDFFKMKKLYLEAVLRFFYILATLGCFIIGFMLLFGKLDLYFTTKSTFAMGLALMIVGPIALRLTFEASMLGILLVKNVIEINNSVNKKSSNMNFASDNKFTENMSRRATNYAQAISNANAQMKAQQQAQQYQQPYQPQAQQQYQQPQQQYQPQQPAQQATGVKYCAECGNTVPANAAFCNKCGKTIN